MFGNRPPQKEKKIEIKDAKSPLKPFSHVEKKLSLTPFEQQPDDILDQVIFPILKLEDKQSLTRTNKNLNQLFGQSFEQDLLPLKPIHQQLLNHVIHGEEKKARTILEKYPILLLYKGLVMDSSHRKIKGTAYQLALGAEDIGMAKMIRAFLKRLPDGEAEIIRQQEQQFPRDEKKAQPQPYSQILRLAADAKIEDELKDSHPITIAIKFIDNQLIAYWTENSERKQTSIPADQVPSILSRLPEPGKTSRNRELINDITLEYGCANSKELRALLTITKMIRDAKEDEITTNHRLNLRVGLKVSERFEIAFAQFRDSLNPSPDRIITQGKHFNAELLLKALDLFERHYNMFGGKKDSPKNMLFWRQVIGYIQRFFPACYAQAFEHGVKLGRSLHFQHELGVSLFPLDLNPHFRLGYDYAISTWPSEWGLRADPGAAFFRNLCHTKAEGLQTLCNIYATYQQRGIS